MNQNDRRAAPDVARPSQYVQLGGERLQHTRTAAACEEAREFERRSIINARDALTMRGAERFQALSLASTYAVAARDLALNGRAAR